MKKKVIAIDGCGGDFAPCAVIDGVISANLGDVHYLICGIKSELKQFQAQLDKAQVSYEFCFTEGSVSSEMSVGSAIKTGKTSSMGMAIQKVVDKEAMAVISSGNTGAYMAMAKVMIGMIPGIDRPAIAGVMPTEKGVSVMLDLGANAECNVKNLFDFAIMGIALAKALFQKKFPSVSILNIGSEDIKGNTLVKSTSELFKVKLSEYYKGYIEANEITKGNVDVIVTDGFTGNIALKAAEGIATFIINLLKQKFVGNLFYKIIGALIVKPIKATLSNVDPRKHNGAILLGLNGVVVKSHGNSDAIGFANAIKFTAQVLSENLYDNIKEKLILYDSGADDEDLEEDGIYDGKEKSDDEGSQEVNLKEEGKDEEADYEAKKNAKERDKNDNCEQKISAIGRVV